MPVHTVGSSHDPPRADDRRAAQLVAVSDDEQHLPWPRSVGDLVAADNPLALLVEAREKTLGNSVTSYTFVLR